VGPAQKVERLRGSLHCIGAPAQARHTVFVDGEAEAAAFRPDEYFDTPAELVSRTFNRPRRRAPRKCYCCECASGGDLYIQLVEWPNKQGTSCA